MPARVAVVVEDDPDIADLVRETLEGAGFEVHLARRGADGISLARTAEPDLVTLDLELPDFDGIEVCRRIRTASDCYIVMLTGRDAEVDLLVGLGVGADDYMVKPFSPRELRARVQAMLRRPRHTTDRSKGTSSEDAEDPPASTVIDGGAGLRIDLAARSAHIGGDEIPLTRTEFDLLVQMARQPGVVCDRESLVQQLWQIALHDDGHLVNVHVGNLRRKLAALSPTPWIRTVRGVGYRFDPADG